MQIGAGAVNEAEWSFVDEFDLAEDNRLRETARSMSLSLALRGSGENKWPIVSNTKQQNIYAGNGILHSVYKNDSASFGCNTIAAIARTTTFHLRPISAIRMKVAEKSTI